MKRILVLLTLVCSGCATAYTTTTVKEDKVVLCSGYYFSLLKDLSGATMQACGSSGGASESKSNTALGQKLIETGTTLLKLAP